MMPLRATVIKRIYRMGHIRHLQTALRAVRPAGEEVEVGAAESARHGGFLMQEVSLYNISMDLEAGGSSVRIMYQ